MKKFVNVLATLALAFAMSFNAAGVSHAWWGGGNEDLGRKYSKISESDTVTKKEVVAETSPADGTRSGTVKQTTHYLHDRWFRADQTYHIVVNGTAEYVDRLDYWMYKDGDGTLFRFNKGSKSGIETVKPSVDIGARAGVISANDSETVLSVSAGNVSADGLQRNVEVVYRYKHEETYNFVSYTVTRPLTATFVQLQNAHMVWVGNTLYRIEHAGTVKALAGKPTANVGHRTSRISANDMKVTYDPVVSAGPVSFHGSSRVLYATHDYIHEETFQKLRYSIQQEYGADFVSEQRAYMSWIENDLYRVRVGSDDVQKLAGKPVVNIGKRVSKLGHNDTLISVQVFPLSVSSDNRSIVVSVRHNWKHSERYQTKEYYSERSDLARYNDSLKVWTVIVDGRVYAIAFDGDVVGNPDVVVVKAPDSMKKPDVIVVSPGGEDPPVVVPGKKNPGNTDEDPPVVVPGKRKPPVVVDGDEDGPVVVVPRR